MRSPEQATPEAGPWLINDEIGWGDSSQSRWTAWSSVLLVGSAGMYWISLWITGGFPFFSSFLAASDRPDTGSKRQLDRVGR